MFYCEERLQSNLMIKIRYSCLYVHIIASLGFHFIVIDYNSNYFGFFTQRLFFFILHWQLAFDLVFFEYTRSNKETLLLYFCRRGNFSKKFLSFGEFFIFAADSAPLPVSSVWSDLLRPFPSMIGIVTFY